MVVPPLLVRSLGRDLRAHLLELQLHHRVLYVTVAVVGGKHFGGILIAILGHEPTRRLGKKEDSQDDEARRDHLAPDGNPPGLLVGIAAGSGHVAAPVDDPARDDAPDIPSAVVQAGQRAAPRGVRHLAHVARRRHAAEADAETQEEAAREELAAAGGRGLHTGADDDDEGAGEHAPAAAEGVVDGAGEEDGGGGADVV